jgi:hypothetical protein
MGGYGGQQQQ